MRTALWIIATTFVGPATVPEPTPEPQQRIVVETTAGDFLIGLSPDTPLHHDLIIRLVSAGAYDSGNVGQVSPGYYAQLYPPVPDPAIVDDVLEPEPTAAGNIAWSVSMNADERTDAAPSLTIVVTDNPQLDERYTPVGAVVAGFDVVTAIIATNDQTGPPKPAVAVTRMWLIGGDADVVLLAGPSIPTVIEPTPDGFNDAAPWLAGLILMVGIGQFAFASRLRSRAVASIGLLVAEVAFFVVWASLGSRAGGNGTVGLLLFLGAFGNFWLMGRFERRS